MFHHFLARQSRINACALAWWTHSVFYAFAFPTLVLFQQRLPDRMACSPRKYSAFNQWSPCNVSPHSAPAMWLNACVLAWWTHSAFRAFAFPTPVLYQQRLLDRMAYSFRKYPVFNQWSLCSVSPHFAPTASCKRLCSGLVDTRRLSHLRRFLRLLSSINGWLDRMAYSLRELSIIQPMVTVQYLTTF